jgi:predicted metal-dependent peptidase
MTDNESLEKISKSLMLKEPFYGLFLIMLNKVWRQDVPTAGVSRNNINFQLAINPEFWNSLSEDHKIGLLKHELLHICFHHLSLRDILNDHRIFNIAADIEINQYIDGHQLPEGALLPKSFPELSLGIKEGTKTYYTILLDAAQNNKSKALNDLLEQLANNPDHPTNHSTWNEFDELDESTKKLIEKQANHLMNEVADQIKKAKGQIPGLIANLLDKINLKEEPKFDWKGYLRRFAGGSSKIFTKKLRRKFNKRYEDSPGLKIKPKKHILVAVDTSGSVSQKELVEFFQEINHIHKTGTEITVVQCDSAISSIEEYNPRKEIKLHGRGGTSFEPVIEMYNNNKKYCSLIYFTDGECSTQLVPRGRCLWVLSAQSHDNNELPGNVIKLN